MKKLLIIFGSLLIATPVYADVLIVGDSHMYGEFGQTLHKRVAQHKKDVTSYSVCGATSFSYLKRWTTSCGYVVRETKSIGEEPQRVFVRSIYKAPSIYKIVEKVKPDIVIVVLGTNNTLTDKSTEKILKKFVSYLLNNSTKVYWVGPLSYKEKTDEIHKITLSNLQRVTYIDSRPHNKSKPLSLKQPHVYGKEAKKWAEWTFKQMKGTL